MRERTAKRWNFWPLGQRDLEIQWSCFSATTFRVFVRHGWFSPVTNTHYSSAVICFCLITLCRFCDYLYCFTHNLLLDAFTSRPILLRINLVA
ncbi:hypothetical protein L873DRAFT_364776 [Choiromyces venosus 120613-1]|uniref:Uncharacterized protein n=1 Tax=Choiromyces venosus 120613-1 TaxID=1336337 RepID=A0A3N4K2U8_9PEZI|nr:hypothetical protein L873DRAFT_364776 [Choiromyces venosus 120613-1]